MIRRVLAVLAVALFVILVIAQRGELASLAGALASAAGVWLAAAVLAQLLSYTLMAWLYRGALAAGGARVGLGDCATLLMASLSVNLLAPSAGAAGAALWIDTLGRRGHARARVAAAVVLAMACDLAGLVLLTLAVLSRSLAAGKATPLEWTGAALLMVIAGGLVGVLGITARRPDWTRGALAAIRAAVTRVAEQLGRRSPLPPDWPDRTAAELQESARSLAGVGAAASLLPLLACAAHALSATALGALALAFDHPMRAGAVLGAYTWAQAVWILSPVPQGMGAVEGALTVAIVATGAPLPHASGIALCFRGLTFWAPMVAGFFLLRRLRSPHRSAPRNV